MPQSLLRVETIANRRRRGGSAARLALGPSGGEGSPRRSSWIVIALASKMLANRLHREAADRPDRKRDKRDSSERAPAPRVQGALRKARRHKAFDIDVLSIGVVARPIERLERVLISRLGKFPLGVESLIRSEFVR